MKYIKILVLCLAFMSSYITTAQAVGTPYLPDSYIPFSFLYGGNASESMRNSIGNSVQTSDGGYIIVGGSDSSANGDVSGTNRGASDAWILKVDAFGKKQWEKLYGGSQDEYAMAVKQTADGGYIVACITQSSNSGNVGTNHGPYNTMDSWILKLDASGNIVWNKLYGGSGGETAEDILQTTDGGYIIVTTSGSSANGDVSPVNHGMGDVWVLKIDASGNKLWDKLYGGDRSEQNVRIIKTSDGGYVISAYAQSSNGDVSGVNRGDTDFWILKLNASGNKMWDKTYGGSGQDVPYSIRQTADSGYIIVGNTQSEFSGDVNGSKGGWIVKLNASGSMIWNKVIGSKYSDYAYNAQQTSDNGYLIAGTNDTNSYVLKLDNSGNLQWEKTYGRFAYPVSLQPTADGNYCIGGFRASQAGVDITNGAFDLWLMKIDPLGNIITVPDVGQ